jgi:hypothetical protein
MALIDPPVPPPQLFRYRKVSSIELAEQELSAISKNYLWCSGYKPLNDPMEGVYGVSLWLAKQPTLNRLGREILGQKRSVGVCCFSDTFDNELMWAHYAENYTGMCIAYSTKQLMAGLGDNVHVVRVSYDGNPPRIGEADVGSPQQAARRILSHKKACWSYEREWRFLVEAVEIPGPLQITRERAVKTIYLGSRVKEEVRTRLVKELGKMKIPIRVMKVSGYKHEWTAFRMPAGATP